MQFTSPARLCAAPPASNRVRPRLASGTVAAMLTVFSSNGIRAVLLELAPEFERRSGHKLAVTFNPANLLKEQIDAGAPFDVAILTPPVMDDAVKDGRIAASTRHTIARTGCGIAVLLGAPKPDIGTVEAFTQALLAARSIAATRQGASGMHFARVIEQLGIADAVTPKMKWQAGGLTGELAARGEVEVAVQLLSELKAVAGIDIVGPFPADLQHYTVMVAGVGAAAREPAAAAALIAALTSKSARPILDSRGMEPA
jgi:molybdate transport system substrate-binding protein